MKCINLRSDKSGDCNMQQLAAVNPILISFLRLLCGYHRFHFVCLLMAGMFTLYPFFPSWLSLLSFDIQISLKKKSLFYATADLEKRVGAIKEEGLKGFFFFFVESKTIDFLFSTLYKQYKCTYLEEVSMHKFLFCSKFQQ